MVVRETNEFAAWLALLRDPGAKAKIVVRIQRLAAGNAGDVKPVGEGVSEMRIDHGPGYRVYYASRGKELAVVLCGGTKKAQANAVKRAKQLAKEL